jgi:pentose-5-phosphate-3-epimerase/putative flippase GtrA
MSQLTSTLRKWLSRPSRSALGYLIYRYRYLFAFTLIGFASILVEIALVKFVLPETWPWPVKAILGFVLGMFFSFALNAALNFQVRREYLLSTFVRFAMISVISFSLNILAMFLFREVLRNGYGESRLISSALLFLLAYTAHRKFTFNRSKNFGVAIYAAKGEVTKEIFERLGQNCDHLHIDLVDETMNANARPVDLQVIREAKALWPKMPVALHIMSTKPGQWIDQTIPEIDWYLIHLNIEEDVSKLIFHCRMHRKQVGIVWHVSMPPDSMLQYLPHVDFVMVLGVQQPGQSGQKMLEEAIAVTDALDEMAEHYGYEVMFDGGVSPKTLDRIRARYVVAASAVLAAQNPIEVANVLRSGVPYEQRRVA